jgi:YVTN family beta-propeller protein
LLVLSVALPAVAAGAVGAAGEGAGPVLGFVGKSGNDAARAFDLGTGLPVGGDIDLLPEGDYPYDATIMPDGSRLWITGAVGDGVIVIDTATQGILERIDLSGVADYPVDVIFDPCAERAFVASRDSEVVAVISTANYQLIDTVDVPTGFLGAGKMAVSAQRNELYVVDWFDSSLIVIDLETLVPTPFDLGDSFWDLAISPDQDTLYVTDRGTDQVRVVDLDSMTVVDNVAVGDDPWGIDITPDGSTVVVASEDDQTVTLFDTTTLIPQTLNLAADSDPRDVEIETTGQFAYVPAGEVAGNDLIYVIDVAAGTLADSIDVGEANTNVVAVRPQPGSCAIFEDGFESGDTSAWSATVP